MKQYKNIDEYIAEQPDERKEVLKHFRQIIKKAAPQAEEVISYGMPAFKQNGSVLVYFSAAKNHYGFYPTSKPIEAFKDKLTQYKTSKGAIQFTTDKPLPEKLITEIVKFRLQDNAASRQLKTSAQNKAAKRSNKK